MTLAVARTSRHSLNDRKPTSELLNERLRHADVHEVKARVFAPVTALRSFGAEWVATLPRPAALFALVLRYAWPRCPTPISLSACTAQNDLTWRVASFGRIHTREFTARKLPCERVGSHDTSGQSAIGLHVSTDMERVPCRLVSAGQLSVRDGCSYRDRGTLPPGALYVTLPGAVEWPFG